MHVPTDVRILSVPTVEAAVYIPDFESTTTTATYIRHAALEFGADPDSLLATLTCESDLDIHAVGDSNSSFGISQIHLPAHPEISKEQALDPEWSIDWAARMFAQGRQSMWTCYNMKSPAVKPG